MRWEIEPTGCCEHKGQRQIRLCFYLEPGDARYKEHHVDCPVIPKDGYPGSKNSDGSPRSEKKHKQWHNALPKKWQTNPFHNHFIYVALDATDEDIAKQAEALLPQFYRQWQHGVTPGVKNGRH